MIAHKQKKTKKKRVLSSGQLSTDVTAPEMGLKSISSNSIFDPDYIKELVNDIRKFSHMLLYLKEAILSDCFKEVIHIRLDELLRVLKSVMNKHQNLNSVDLQNAAEMLTAKVKAVNFTEVNEENKNDLFKEVFSSIETLAFTFGNILTNFLMGDVGNDSLLRLPVSRESKSFENVSVESVDSSNEKGNFSPIELDSVLLKNTDSVELALSYAKTWSKYTKNIVSWVEKKLNLELESTRNIVKLAEATRSNIGMQEFMPLQSLFTSALLSDIKNSHLLQQTIAALQANKFVQPLLGRKNEMEKQRKEIKELWKQEQNKMLETETALKKAKLLCMQRQDEYEKAKSSMFRAEEEHLCSTGGVVKNLNKQLEKKRRLEEEALQKVEEANELYKVCVTNVEERRNDLENTKREILTQLQKLVFQCDLTLKAVSFFFFQYFEGQGQKRVNICRRECDTTQEVLNCSRGPPPTHSPYGCQKDLTSKSEHVKFLDQNSSVGTEGRQSTHLAVLSLFESPADAPDTLNFTFPGPLASHISYVRISMKFLNKSFPFLDNKVGLLIDLELESTSQKMEDVCKTSKPLNLKSDREANSVERHAPRTKMRPVSLPVDRLLLLASPPNERNGRNMGTVNSDKFCKNPTFEGVSKKDTPSVGCSKLDGSEQSTLQSPWEQQWEQNGLTVKTAVTVPSALQDRGLTTSPRITGGHPVSAAQPSKPYSEPVRPARQVSGRRSSDSCPPAPVRAPRTLQPQHWTTFYKPRAPMGGVKGDEEKPAAPSPAPPPSTTPTPQGHALRTVPDSENAPAAPTQPTRKPKESPEERDLPDVPPACQRPRLKRMQQFEDLEDEIPQFV
uniref:rho GTPase-activating protein 29-like n=1 Tax=Panthera onca TaxID=9690 RepID=UPI0029557472|nr:rho GTPase-activating protein 29-like [Panthera onca]